MAKADPCSGHAFFPRNVLQFYGPTAESKLAQVVRRQICCGMQAVQSGTNAAPRKINEGLKRNITGRLPAKQRDIDCNIFIR